MIFVPAIKEEYRHQNLTAKFLHYFRCTIFRYSAGNSPVLFLKEFANLPALLYPIAAAICSIVKSVAVSKLSAWLNRRCSIYSVTVQRYACLNRVLNFVLPMQAIWQRCSTEMLLLKWSLMYAVTFSRDFLS